MDYTNPDALVSTEWLAAHLDAPDVRVVDGSWHMPALGRDPAAEFDAAHIPGAVFFDIDDIADETNPLPHMLPSPEKFSSRVRKLGLGDGVKIVAYDATGMGSAARVWWTFRVFGHHDVAVTLRTYAHLLPGMHSEAMNAIGNLIFGPPATENVTRSVT